MKIGVILCLAAGPLVAPAQQPGISLRPGIGQASQAESVFGWKRPGIELRPFQPAVRPAPAVATLLPDRMCYLVAAGTDPMPTDRGRSLDPMPNGMKQVKIAITVR